MTLMILMKKNKSTVTMENKSKIYKYDLLIFYDKLYK